MVHALPRPKAEACALRLAFGAKRDVTNNTVARYLWIGPMHFRIFRVSRVIVYFRIAQTVEAEGLGLRRLAPKIKRKVLDFLHMKTGYALGKCCAIIFLAHENWLRLR